MQSSIRLSVSQLPFPSVTPTPLPQAVDDALVRPFTVAPAYSSPVSSEQDNLGAGEVTSNEQ